MSANTMPASSTGKPGRDFLILCACLVAVLGIFFYPSFQAAPVLFCNDGPYGAQAADYNKSPDSLKGSWIDLYLLGVAQPCASPKLTFLLHWLMGPLAFSKFVCPLALVFLGISAWLFFRALKFHRWVCLLGGLAAALNGNVFSTACWGLVQWAAARGFIFLALALLVSGMSGRAWIKAALAGLCVGFAVMEGFDVGALYSILVGVFAFFIAFLSQGEAVKRAGKGVLQALVVAAFAGWAAAHIITTLVGTQVVGIAGTAQDQQTKAERWNFATQWSLPKQEALRVMIPGLFGYRMDTGGGGNYWGFVGHAPGTEFYRYSGSGEYAGVLVVLVAAWALAQASRRKPPVYSAAHRKQIWFWAVAALVCLLFAFGRHAPFYQLLYQLPFFSTIRNPIKFMYLFHVALLVLFGFGLQALCQQYLEGAEGKRLPLGERLRQWWRNALPGERRAALGQFSAFGAAVLGGLIYAANRGQLVKFLQKVGFPNEKQASQIAGFSLGEVWLFLLFFGLCLAALVLVWSGFFKGRRPALAVALLGLILVADLVRANQPWVIYYDYKERYAQNPVIAFLSQKPYEQRVASFLPLTLRLLQQIVIQNQQQLAQDRQVLNAAQQTFADLQNMQAFYSKEWLEHLFPFYDIPSLDIAQIPRLPEEYHPYQAAFSGLTLLPRYWELTSTRYLLAPAELAEARTNQAPDSAYFDQVLKIFGLSSYLNGLDGGKGRFKVKMAFDYKLRREGVASTATEDFTVDLAPQGRFALVEFTGALPRVCLLPNWETSPDDKQTLARLVDPKFDPAQNVLVAELPGDIPRTNHTALTNVGTVTITSYSPRQIKLTAKVTAPAILLNNDRYTKDWKAVVNGAPAPLLRCNFIDRGLYLKPGEYTIELRFEPLYKILYVSLAAMGVGLGLALYLLVVRPKSPQPEASPAPAAPARPLAGKAKGAK